MKKKIEIKYHTDMVPIKKITVGDWIDLRAAEEITVHPGEVGLISLGISMKLPKGYEAHIVPRSSTFKTWGIVETNSMGVIDNSYSGENDIWKFPFVCLKAKDEITNTSTIRKNDRICQFRIVKKQPKLKFKTVNHMKGNSRGGFGSTGKN